MSTALGLGLEPSGERLTAGAVVIHNAGSGRLRVYRPGTSWGDEALRFELSAGGEKLALARRNGTYTRNVPATLELHSGESLRVDYDLTDGSWEVDPELLERADAIRALYVVEHSVETTERGVWTGQAAGEAIHR